MAALFPPVPPDAPPPQGAEERFVRSLAALSDPWRVYHRLSWYDTSTGGVREGEADVVLLHPEHGLLVLEVKGGGIAYDGDTGKWTSAGRNGLHTIQDPFAQAQRSVKFLAGEIARRWPEISDGPLPAFVHGHAVAFPDCAWTGDRLPVFAPRELILDRSDLEDGPGTGIVPAIDRLVKRWRSGRSDPAPLGAKCVKKIGQILLKPRFELAYLPLAAGFARDDERLASLTPAQQIALDFLDANPRGRIHGFAGSGKTVIAFEHALRLQAAGRRVLFLCFNLPLAAELRRMAAPVLDGPAGPAPLWIGAFHQLTEETVRRADLPWNPPPATSPDASRFWDEEAPRLMQQAAAELPRLRPF